MGFNSVIFLCNDAIGQIKNDPEGWWDTTWAALNETETMQGTTFEYGFGNHANGFRAVWNRHADDYALIAVGGNYATVIDSGRGYGSSMWGHHEPGAQVAILRQAAERLGYDLVPSHKSGIVKAYESFKRWRLERIKPHFRKLWHDHFEGLLGDDSPST
jgi:hypothetical protein